MGWPNCSRVRAYLTVMSRQRRAPPYASAARSTSPAPRACRESRSVPLVALLAEGESDDRAPARDGRQPARGGLGVAARHERGGRERAGEERARRAAPAELLGGERHVEQLEPRAAV